MRARRSVRLASRFASYVSAGHAVDARRAILARQTKRLEHPFEVDQMMQRGEHPLGMFPRQFGYPLSFRGQVFGTQSSLPCFPQWSYARGGSLSSSGSRRAQFPAFIGTMKPLRLPPRLPFSLWLRLGVPSGLGCFRVRHVRSRRGRAHRRARSIVHTGAPWPGISIGRERELSGSLATHPAPLPCSETPAKSVILAIDGLPDAAPGPNTAKASAFA